MPRRIHKFQRITRSIGIRVEWIPCHGIRLDNLRILIDGLGLQIAAGFRFIVSIAIVINEVIVLILTR